MHDLEPLDNDALDPRVAAQLQPGEKVFWQARPRAKTFASGGLFVGLALVLLALLLPTGAIDDFFVIAPPGTMNRLLFNVGCLGAGLFVLYLQWNRRGMNWSYALTDRRLLSVRGDKVIRDLPPENLFRVEVRDGVVRWKTAAVRTEGEFEGKEGRRPGFYGLDDPEAVAELIRRWRNDFTDRAENAAQAFTEAPEHDPTADESADETTLDSRTEATAQPGKQRIHHPGTGLSLAVPEEWTVTMARYRRPLAYLGLAPLKRFGILGEEQPFADEEPWDQLVARGAPELALSLIIREGPIRANQEKWLNPGDMAKRFRIETVERNAGFHVGSLTGFSVLRRMPPRAVLTHFGQVAEPVLLRMAWVGNAMHHVEFAAIAPADRPEIMTALDNMMQSLEAP